ncbi:hypothetical protein [Salibacter halophilus]|uniref:AraC family transcriptional regulator n=1 Tax=Salibacter halophilus TaxID=1803916 RepID=A0A6N6M5X8_9FLAO|nr:hypothetical protein [Salibacter halophilus]KAB1065111.1 hypothetical protein F3059_03940 [Salibacter halophilus]
MFDIKEIPSPITLHFITKYSFPEGISKAWAELEHHIPVKSGVKFYGIFDGQQYFAGSDYPSSFSISKESLHEYVIPAGNYITVPIINWQDKKEQIAVTFQRIEEDPRCDKTSADIEFYKSHIELICLKRLRF